jgi:predicted TIM-barrel fold metal-dependent hydrolase
MRLKTVFALVACLMMALNFHAIAADDMSTKGAAKMAVDCHSHVFNNDLSLTKDRRYTLDYNATPEDYLKMLDAHGMTRGVLIQPSFLGTDNSYLVAALQTYPKRLRGVIVVDPSISEKELREFDKSGVVGIRLNLIGKPDPDFSTDAWKKQLSTIAHLGWQVEIHAEAKRLPSIMPALLKTKVKVVIDHFGRPDVNLGVEDPGFKYLLSTGKSGLVWVKISAAYRNGPQGEDIAFKAIPLLKKFMGVDHLLWGSDWPHTQNEKTTNYTVNRDFFNKMISDEKEREIILVKNPAKLFKFDR